MSHSVLPETLALFGKDIDACWFHANTVHTYHLDMNLPTPHTFKYISTATNIFVTEATSLQTFQLILSTGRGFAPKPITAQTIVELKGNVVYVHHPLDEVISAYYLSEASKLYTTLINILGNLNTPAQLRPSRSTGTGSPPPTTPAATEIVATKPNPTTPHKQPVPATETPKQQRKSAKKAAANAATANANAVGGGTVTNGTPIPFPATAVATTKVKNTPVKTADSQMGSFSYEMNKLQTQIAHYASLEFLQSVETFYGPDGPVISAMLSSLDAQLRSLTLLTARSGSVQLTQLDAAAQTNFANGSPFLHHHPHHLNRLGHLTMGLIPPNPVEIPMVIAQPPPPASVPQASPCIDDIKKELLAELRVQVDAILASNFLVKFLENMYGFFHVIRVDSNFSEKQSIEPINELLKLCTHEPFLKLLINTDPDTSIQFERSVAQYALGNTLFDSITMLHPSLAPPFQFQLFEQNYTNVKLFIQRFMSEQQLLPLQTPEQVTQSGGIDGVELGDHSLQTVGHQSPGQTAVEEAEVEPSPPPISHSHRHPDVVAVNLEDLFGTGGLE